MALSKILPAGQSQFAGAMNFIINGALTVWQRSISSTSTGWGYYTADRWNTNLRDGAGTMSQYDMGSELQPFIYALKTAMTSAATSNPVVQQKVEDSRRFKNQTVTFSFYAKSSKAITVDTTFDLLWANSSNATTTQSNSITTSWQRFTYTVTLPNPSGTYNATYDHLYCRFSLPISDTYDFYITGVQLEIGEVASPDFEHEDIGTTLRKCQRYCTVLTSSSFMYRDYYSTDTMVTSAELPVTMRVTPSVTMTGSGGTSSTGFTYTNLAAAPTLSATNPQSIIVYRGVASSARTYIYLASTGELTMEAEL